MFRTQTLLWDKYGWWTRRKIFKIKVLRRLEKAISRLVFANAVNASFNQMFFQMFFQQALCSLQLFKNCLTWTIYWPKFTCIFSSFKSCRVAPPHPLVTAPLPNTYKELHSHIVVRKFFIVIPYKTLEARSMHFEKQDLYKNLGGLSPPKTSRNFNKGVPPPDPPLEITHDR